MRRLLDFKQTDRDSISEKTGNRAFQVKPNTLLRVVGIIAFIWCAFCCFCLIFGIVVKDRDLIVTGLGEGIAVFILGIMFNTLSTAIKESRYVTLLGKRIKKIPFVAVSIALSVLSLVIIK